MVLEVLFGTRLLIKPEAASSGLQTDGIFLK